jgi:hypothetical protein
MGQNGGSVALDYGEQIYGHMYFRMESCLTY